VLVTGITAMIGEGPCAAAVALLERAEGLRVVDPNLRPGLWGSDRAADLVRPLIERCDLLLGGEAELDVVVGGTGRDLAERCRTLGPREVVLKRGAAGAAALGPEGEWVEWTGALSPNVDPVGAGDAFNAGYVAARLNGRSIAAALELGAQCGAGVAGAVGDTAGFPNPADLEGGWT
jgi:2-dehydro-3-deoxygluconokinase